VVSSTARPRFTPGKDPVPIVQEAGWAAGPAWTGGKSRPHRDSISDRPARSSVAISTKLPGPQKGKIINTSQGYIHKYEKEIRPVAAVLIHVDRRTGGRDEYNRCFSLLC